MIYSSYEDRLHNRRLPLPSNSKFLRARTPIVSFNNYRNMDANKSIEQRIEELESLVYASKNVLSFDEASKFLSLSKSYLYKLTSAGLIPHYKPQGKMIYFEKNILEEWLRQNPVKTQAQIASEAQKYLFNRK